MDLLSPSSPTAWGIKPVAQDSFSPRHSWNPRRKLCLAAITGLRHRLGLKPCPSPTADKSWLIRSLKSVIPPVSCPIFLSLCHQDSLPGLHLTPSQTSAGYRMTPTPGDLSGGPAHISPESSCDSWASRTLLLQAEVAPSSSPAAISSFTFPPS